MDAGDRGMGRSHLSAIPKPTLLDHGNWNVKWRLRKFQGDLTPDQCLKAKPFKVIDFEHNGLANVGINELWKLVCGGTATAFSNANAYLGVGDSNTAFAASQTDLQAVTNKTYKAMDTSYPTYGTSQKSTFKSTFGSADANYAWEEVATFNGNNPPTANMLNRKVQSLGTKASGTTWELTCEITIS